MQKFYMDGADSKAPTWGKRQSGGNSAVHGPLNSGESSLLALREGSRDWRYRSRNAGMRRASEGERRERF